MTASPAVPLRPLLLLAAAVLAAHLLLLRTGPRPVPVSPTLGTQPFVTRSVADRPAAAAATLPPAGLQPAGAVKMTARSARVARSAGVVRPENATAAAAASVPTEQA